MKRLLRSAIVATTLVLTGAIVLDRVFPPDLARYRTRSLEVQDASGVPLDIVPTPDGMWRLAATPDTVDPAYVDMLLTIEDRRYWWHPGVDPLALARAAWQLATHGHFVSGGSTLTMQVARLLTPHPHTVAGKLFDIARALQLEAHFGKREILSFYLTLAPLGGNIEGARAASLLYFGHEPSSLTPYESALLVALPRSPARLRPDRHPERAQIAVQQVLRRALPDEHAELGETEAVTRHPAAALTPHLAQKLRSGSRSGIVRTTLDGTLQRAVSALAIREQPWLGDKAQLATLIVRNKDRAILAYLGGVDYLGAAGGMIDMAEARRSPGSTLKPFIYGMGFDDGLILPNTILDDVPLRVGDYTPRNFDRDFHGMVTVREALQQSYNLPAVKILQQVGAGRFAATLRQAGAVLALPTNDAGATLPIALGGLGISLRDLTSLYVALANGGQPASLVLEKDQPAKATSRLMSESAARQIGDILRDTPRPDGVSAERPRPIAYKTGTSYGFRDAWAVGYSPQYTVAVWTGRVDGSPIAGAIGRSAAAPILFKIFDLLPMRGEALPAAPVAAVQDRQAPLAPGLRRFSARTAIGLIDGPHIVYPPAGAAIASRSAAGARTPVDLQASGGTPPYRWLIDGVPLAEPPLGTSLTWLPDGPGFSHIAVIDAADRAASASVRIK